MENKINIAELLKDCPKGMELDCTVFENLTFEEIDEVNSRILCNIQGNNGKLCISFNKFGCYSELKQAKCVIFPKGKTTWEGFVPPSQFKDGDIITSREFGDICIFKGEGEIKGTVDFYCGVVFCNLNKLLIKNIEKPKTHFGNISKYDFASKQDKQKLFQAIKDNGYKWNAETKTLEKLIESKEDTNDKVVMSGIYFDREYYDDEVELHLGNYEIEIRDGKTYAIFKNKETKTMEKLIKEFKVGDKIKDTRNNSEGIILKVTDKGFECRFEFGNFLVTFSEQDYFNLVPNKSDIILKQSYMEEINLDWCKQHGMTLSQVNVARDTSYYLETNGYIILVYTTSTTGDQKLHVINPTTKKEIEFSLSRLNRDLNKLNSITTDDLRKLCELVNLDYPFKS